VSIDPASERTVDMLVAPLRLLPMPWAYDNGTGTLFTSDVFGWVTRPGPEGPWEVTEGPRDATTAEDVWHYLVANRYWWLPGAQTTRLLDDLAALLATIDVQNIAPGYGCVLRGRAVAERHIDLLRQALERAPEEDSIGLSVGTWTFGAAA
jgi:hypothetical protein